MNKKYKKYIVAHLDVLGTKDLLSSKKSSLTFLKTLNGIYQKALGRLNALNINLEENYNGNIKINVKIFSDNICLFIETADRFVVARPLSLFLILDFISTFQSIALLEYDMLLRGGIDIGDFYADEVFIMGPALSSAYRIESEIANYSRVVIGDSLKKEIYSKNLPPNHPFHCYLRKDLDGELIVNYIENFNLDESFIEKHKNIIIEKFLNAVNLNVRSKILNLILYHNQICLFPFFKDIDQLSRKEYLIDIDQLFSKIIEK